MTTGMTKVLTSEIELAPGKQCSWFREKPAFKYQCLTAGFSRNQLHFIRFVGAALSLLLQFPRFRSGAALYRSNKLRHSNVSRWINRRRSHLA